VSNILIVLLIICWSERNQAPCSTFILFFPEIRAEKGQTKKVNLGWHRDIKENPISAPSIHVVALVGAGSLWPDEPTQKFYGVGPTIEQQVKLGKLVL
jgi:hypothetical protein